MQVGTERQGTKCSNGSTYLLRVNYGDAGHTTTSTNHIAVLIRTLVGNCAIRASIWYNTENDVQSCCYGYMTHCLVYMVI